MERIRVGTCTLTMAVASTLAIGCVAEDDTERLPYEGEADAPLEEAPSLAEGDEDAIEEDADEDADADAEDEGPWDTGTEPVVCAPKMNTFPVATPHNIGYDGASCGTGTCAVSCPDVNANSDWGGAHHGIDIFAHHGAPLVATADGVVVKVGVVSDTSGLRVRLRDHCGWEYYYGHLDDATVSPGDIVSAGDLIGFMGATGTHSPHLHFNVSPDGGYSNDINPIDLLKATSPTACGAPPPAPEPPPPPPPAPDGDDCGIFAAGESLGVNASISSCDGRFSLVVQGDGNLVHYQNGGGALWHTQTHGQVAGSLEMQADGNLVLYAPNGTPMWHANTHGNPGTWLKVQNDGNLVLTNGFVALWHAGTGGH